MRPSYKRPYYFIHNVNSYPADTSWKQGEEQGNFLGGKINYEGNFGRVPSENIYIPTDGGNTDIQHLKKLTDPGSPNQLVKSRYEAPYVDDNNHYFNNDRKYGISRYLDFSNYEATDTSWRRTGRGKIQAEVDINGDGRTDTITLGDVNFVPALDTYGDFVGYDTITEGNNTKYIDIRDQIIKVLWNTSVVESLGANVTITGAVD
jgi:hypothetical protein